MDSVARRREKGIPPNGWWSSPGLFDDLELAAGTGGQVFEPRQNRRFVPPGWEPGLPPRRDKPTVLPWFKHLATRPGRELEIVKQPRRGPPPIRGNALL